MKLQKAILCILVVCLLMSMVIPMVSAKKPPKPPGGEDPPADPAIAFFDGSTTKNPNKLYVMNDDGSNQAVILKGTSTWNFHPRGGLSWAPDGSSITWAGFWWFPTGGPPNNGVWRIDVNVVDGEPQGSNLQQLVGDEDCYLGNGAAWSPLGDEIVYAGADRQSNNWWIKSISPAGGTPETVYETLEIGINVRSLTWSSDGTRIAFIETEMSSGDKYIKIIERATGTVTHTLVKGQYDLGGVDWAQDLDTLAFFAEDPRMIYTMDIDTETPIPVVDGTSPSWSPDNTKLAYLTFNRRGPRGIYTIDLTSGETTELTKAGFMPDWRRF